MDEQKEPTEPITWDGARALMEDLRGMARGLLALEGNARSLFPTALVQSALLRLVPGGTKNSEEVRWGEVSWPNRNYFLGAAYKAMRRVLIDHARKRKRKRSLRPVRLEEVHLENLVAAAEDRPEQVEALAEAVERLRERHPDWAELAEHRYYSGYTAEEAARVMKIPERSARRYWEQARLLLHDEILRILNEERITRVHDDEFAS
jgi:RNA polymerase sigma factor (TIGR02999 family)